MILQPLAAGVVLMALDVHGEDLAIGVILAGAPTATAAYIMAQQLKSDAELSGSIIMLSTALSPLTYTFGLYLLSLFTL